MYDFVDRPVTRLAQGSRFLLYAARGWIHAAASGGCPPGLLAPAFARHNVLPALPHFHTMLAEFNHRARDKIAFAPLGCARVAEYEAVLLQLCRDATEAPARARATMSLLVQEEALSNAFTALLTTVARLDEGGMGEMGLIADGVTGRA